MSNKTQRKTPVAARRSAAKTRRGGGRTKPALPEIDFRLDPWQMVNAAISAAHAQRYRRMLRGLVARTSRDLDITPFLRADAQQLGIACLYATILQYVRECASQLGRPSISVPVVIRSLLEAYADFCALLKDPKYLQLINATLLSERERLLKAIITNPANPYAADIGRKIDAAGDLRTVKTQLENLKQKGYHPPQNKERFTRSNLGDLYQVAYWSRCLDSHNALTTLEARHVVAQGNDRFELVLVKPSTPARISESADFLMGILVDASAKLHAFLGTGRSAAYEKWRARLDLFREELFPPPGTQTPPHVDQ
jgi:uncharacterized protein DUF5677